MKGLNSILLNAICSICLLAPLAVSAQVDVLMQHNDLERTGANLKETALTPESVNGLRFGMLFKRVVDDQIYTQPLVVTNVKIGGGWHDVVYVTTVNNSVYAFDANDAQATAPFWHVNFGTPANLHDADFGCLDINGNMGIIGTPAIDRADNILYVVALTKTSKGFAQRIHALDLATGADVEHSPATIQAPDFNPLMQNQRPALLLSAGKLYVGYASHCDKDPYHGFLFAFNAATLQKTAVFNTTPGGEEGSIWQSGQAPAVDEKGNIYFVTGNGSWDGITQFSESFIKLDSQLHMLDWFTPTNHFQLDKEDNDLNSSGAMLIPGSHLVIGGGKQGVLYAIDTAHFGHLGDEHAMQHFPATGSHLHSMVYWHSARSGNLLYLWGQRDHLRAYHFVDGRFQQNPIMMRPEKNDGHPGAMLSISASGDKDGILWAAIHASGDSWHESRPGILHAYDADDINHELWNSLDNPGRDDCNNYSKMAPPSVSNGKVYLASFGTRDIGSGQMCVYGLLPAGPPPNAPSNVQAAVEGRLVKISWSPIATAITYTVESENGGAHYIVASGLTRPSFIESAIAKGKTAYFVTAVNSNGSSIRSAPASAQVEKVPIQRMMH